MNRLDIMVAEKEKISRELAKELISKGLVKVDDKIIYKSGLKYEEYVNIKVDMPKKKFVSRGGLKLDCAIDAFEIDIENKVCMDVGASTGGFTDCLLQRGAHLVYAVDVGRGQLVEDLRLDSRVISMEETNINELNKENLKTSIDVIVVDVSFVSLTKILDSTISLLKDDGVCICLVKPQFECGPKKLNRRGIVTDKKVHLKVIKDIYEYIDSIGCTFLDLINSPIEGKGGNREYLLYISKPSNGAEINKKMFAEVVANIVI